jgi:hypothetical protein
MSTVAVRQALAPHHLIASSYRHLVGAGVQRWVSANGFDWAADRCKSIVQYLLLVKAGDTASVRPKWVSERYLRYADRVARRGTSAKFLQLVQVWRCFTALSTRLEPRWEDIDKFESAVASPWCGPISNDVFLQRISIDGPRDEVFLRKHFVSTPKDLLPEVHLTTVEVVNPMVLSRRDSTGKITRQWQELVTASSCLQQSYKTYGITPIPYALRQIPEFRDDDSPPLYGDDEFLSTCTIGAVRARVQKDGKTRFFYDPPYWAQFLLGDWAKTLYHALSLISQDCTYNQEKGARVVQGWLKEGEVVSSIDLTSATDRMPLPLSRAVLMGLSGSPNLKMWVDTFCILSRQPAAPLYSHPHHRSLEDDDEDYAVTVEWQCGQPLGLIPSFAVFALTHHYLVREAATRVGLPADYVLLGDDVVIRHPRVAQAYRRSLDRLGVPVSMAKSVTGQLAEFAGRVILGDAFEFKSKAFPVTYTSLLSAISLLGPRALKSMRQTVLRDIIALIPTPRTPLGVNPGGFPKSQVDLFLTEYFYLEKDREFDRNFVVSAPREVHGRYALMASISDSDEVPYQQQRAPRGAAVVGVAGEPVSGRMRGSTSWKWSPWLTKAWLTRVKRAARAAGMI